MRRLCLLWWPFLLWRDVLCHLRGSANESKDEKLRRRLEAWARRIQVVEHEPELLDVKGLTPIREISGLTLRHVITVNKDNPQLIGHARFSDEYHEARRLRETEAPIKKIARQRRLSAIQTDAMVTVGQTPISFFTPRDRVRLFTVMNAAVLPKEAYVNASLNYWDAGGKVHASPGHMLYTKNATAINDPSLTGTGGWTSALMGNNFSATDEVIANSWRDGEAAYETAKTMRASLAAKPGWASEHFKGLRSGGCATKTDSDPRCWLDAGVAVSVYQEATYIVVVFHSDWSVNWWDYIMWGSRAWVIDEVETQVKNQWTIDARASVIQGMPTRKGLTYDENQERCAFKDASYQHIDDVAGVATMTNVAAGHLSSYGYWYVIKAIMRIVFPETRDRIAEKAYTIYFTGSGFGGVWSTLASMWLKKVDDATYESNSIAGVGFECFARALTFDLIPWDPVHTHIKIYAHVMDVYARINGVAGYVCLYGSWNMTTGSDVHTFCSGIVGFTGPQLMYRGPPKGAYLEAKTQTAVQEARLDFDACHYYTHSPLYAAILFINDKVLMADGTTDGGCSQVAAIPANDQLGECPTASRVEEDCEAIGENNQDFPVASIIAVTSGLACTIVCGAGVGYLCLQRVKNDMWVFGTDKRAEQKHAESLWQTFLGLFGLGQEIHRRQRKRKVKSDRAKQARERARHARTNKFNAANTVKKKRRKAKKNDGDEEWQALKDKLGTDFDATKIGKAEDDIIAAADVLAKTKADQLQDDDEFAELYQSNATGTASKTGAKSKIKGGGKRDDKDKKGRLAKTKTTGDGGGTRSAGKLDKKAGRDGGEKKGLRRR